MEQLPGPPLYCISTSARSVRPLPSRLYRTCRSPRPLHSPWRRSEATGLGSNLNSLILRFADLTAFPASEYADRFRFSTYEELTKHGKRWIKISSNMPGFPRHTHFWMPPALKLAATTHAQPAPDPRHYCPLCHSLTSCHYIILTALSGHV
jgi:hypothetical protein